jgi:hypothetical protein
MLGSSGDNKPISPGKGRVVVKIEGSNSAHTLMPVDPLFSKYDLEFTTADEVPVFESITDPTKIAKLTIGDGYPVDLVPKTWDLTVIAFIYFEVSEGTFDYVAVAKGTITNLDVKGGVKKEQGITMKPYPITANSEKGLFYWELDPPNGEFFYSGTMTFKKANDLTEVWTKKFPRDGSSGTEKVAAGYYVMTLQLTNAKEKSVFWEEAVHIYPGLTTKGKFSFKDTDFVAQKYLEGTFPSNTFTDKATKIMLSVYSEKNNFSNKLKSVSVTQGELWTVQVPVDDRNFQFLAAFTMSNGKIYTLNVGKELNVEDAGRSGIVLSADYDTRPITTWANLKEAVDWLPPVSIKDFSPAGAESDLFIGGSFFTTGLGGTNDGTIVLERAITLQADSSSRTITRGGGITGAFFDIQGDGALTLGGTLEPSLTLTQIYEHSYDGFDQTKAIINVKERGKFTLYKNAEVSGGVVYLAAGLTIELAGGGSWSPINVTLVETTGKLTELKDTPNRQVLSGSPNIGTYCDDVKIYTSLGQPYLGTGGSRSYVDSTGKLQYVRQIGGKIYFDNKERFQKSVSAVTSIRIYLDDEYKNPVNGYVSVGRPEASVEEIWSWTHDAPATAEELHFLIDIDAESESYTLAARVDMKKFTKWGEVHFRPIYRASELVYNGQELREVIEQIPPQGQGYSDIYGNGDGVNRIIGLSITDSDFIESVEPHYENCDITFEQDIYYVDSTIFVKNKKVELKQFGRNEAQHMSSSLDIRRKGDFPLFVIQKGGSLTVNGENLEDEAIYLTDLYFQSDTTSIVIVETGGTLIVGEFAGVASMCVQPITTVIYVNGGTFTLEGSIFSRSVKATERAFNKAVHVKNGGSFNLSGSGRVLHGPIFLEEGLTINLTGVTFSVDHPDSEVGSDLAWYFGDDVGIDFIKSYHFWIEVPRIAGSIMNRKVLSGTPDILGESHSLFKIFSDNGDYAIDPNYIVNDGGNIEKSTGSSQ